MPERISGGNMASRDSLKPITKGFHAKRGMMVLARSG
jgi:hypothetical protein